MNVDFLKELCDLMMKYKVIDISSPLNCESHIHMTNDGKLEITEFNISTDMDNTYFKQK